MIRIIGTGILHNSYGFAILVLLRVHLRPFGEASMIAKIQSPTHFCPDSITNNKI